MASVLYNSFKRDIANGAINLVSDTIKVMLVTSTYAADIDAHTKRSDNWSTHWRANSKDIPCQISQTYR